MLRSSVFLAAALLACCVNAQVAAQRAPTDEELIRFLTAYRATPALLVQMGRAATSHRERGETREANYYDCIASSLSAQTIEDAILPIARTAFVAADDVNAMSDFFEGAVGRKVVRQAIAAVGWPNLGPVPRAAPFRLTAPELEQMQALEQKPPYAAFKAFTRLLNDRIAQSIHGQVFQETRQLCEARTK